MCKNIYKTHLQPLDFNSFFSLFLYFQSSNDNGSKITNFLLEWDEVRAFLVQKKNHNDICRAIRLKNTLCLGTAAILVSLS